MDKAKDDVESDSSSEEENEEESDDKDCIEDEDLLDQLDEEEENQEDDSGDVAEPEDNEEEMTDMSEPKKTRPKKSGNTGRQLPFIAKKKIASSTISREINNWQEQDVRVLCRRLLVDIESGRKLGMKIENVEKYIYNAVIRRLKSGEEKLGQDILQSSKYKKLYIGCFYWLLGEIVNDNYGGAIEELKDKKWSWESCCWTREAKVEEQELARIQNPLSLQEYTDYPCPRCKGIKHQRIKKQTRGGDEGESAIFYCGNNACQYSWKISG